MCSGHLSEPTQDIKPNAHIIAVALKMSLTAPDHTFELVYKEKNNLHENIKSFAPKTSTSQCLTSTQHVVVW